MSEIIKQSMSNIWASAGDIVAPDSVKIADGWLVEVVPRQYWNWMQNRTDTNLAYLFQHGIPEWDATVEYIVNKSYVTYADVVYKAILTGTNKIPSTQPTYWKVAFATSTAALEALNALTPAADKLPYYTGATTAATTTITSLARTLLDDTTQAAMLTTIGAQPVDATLTALAGVTTATNKLPYFSGVDTATVTDLSAFGRSLIDDADATAARSTLVLNNVDNTSDANKPVSTAQQTALNLKANLASPTFTGVPLAPTASLNTATTQVATTAYVTGQAATVVSPMDGTAAVGTSLRYARQDHVHASDTSLLPLTGGNMTGDLIYQNVGVGGWARGLTAKIQSTAAYAAGIGFYGNADSVATVYLGIGPNYWASGNGVRVTAAGVTISGATTFDTLITGSVNGNAATATTLTGLTPTVAELNYVDGVTSSIQTQLNAKAPLASPALTGTPTVPTAAATTNTTQAASTAFVQSQKTTSDTDTTSGRVWRTDDLVKTTTPTDATAGRLTKVGDFGVGGMLDLRGTIFVTGKPQDIYTKGFVKGFADGGPAGLAIPGIASISYGVLEVNAHWSEPSGAGGIMRSFTQGHSGVVYTQTMENATTWGPWFATWNTGNLVKTTSATDTTAGRMLQVGAQKAQLGADVAGTASPAFTGTPTAPTAVAGTNTTQIATTEFVLANAASVIADQLCTAWVNFTGDGFVGIRGGYNVSSVTDLGTGQYRVNFTTAMANRNYAVNVTTSYDDDAAINNSVDESDITVSGFKVNTRGSSSFNDKSYVYIQVFGGK